MSENTVVVAMSVVALSTALGAFSAARANVVPNASFDVAGPLGTSVVVNSGFGGASAAANWSVRRWVATPVTTELLESTSTLTGSGSRMLRLTTLSGFVGSGSNGVTATLLSTLNIGGWGRADLVADAGTRVKIGFINTATGSIDGASTEIVGNGQWQRVSFGIASGATGAVGVFIYGPTNGGSVSITNVFAIPAPGAASVMILAGLSAARRRR